MLLGEWKNWGHLFTSDAPQQYTRYGCDGRTEQASSPPSRLDDAFLARLIARGAIICRRCVNVERA
jgi:hypothetical protein